MSDKTYHIDWIRANTTYSNFCNQQTNLDEFRAEFRDDRRNEDYVGFGDTRSDAIADLINLMRYHGYTIRYSTDLPDELTKLTDSGPFTSPADLDIISTTSLQDPVNSPPHYKQGGIECITAIEAALTPEEYQGYLKGNAFKYIWRSNHKQNHDQDIRKAVWYLNRLEGTE